MTDRRTRTEGCTFLGVMLCLISAACGDGPTDPPAQQLLLNGDIESGQGAPAFWQSIGSSQEYSFEWSGEDAGGGSHSLAIQGVGQGPMANLGYWTQTVPVSNPVGSTFILTASVKVDQVTLAGVSIAIRGDDSSRPFETRVKAFKTTEGVHLITGTNGWTQFSVSMDSLPADVDLINVYLLMLRSGGTVRFDDITLSVLGGRR